MMRGKSPQYVQNSKFLYFIECYNSVKYMPKDGGGGQLFQVDYVYGVFYGSKKIQITINLLIEGG